MRFILRRHLAHSTNPAPTMKCLCHLLAVLIAAFGAVADASPLTLPVGGLVAGKTLSVSGAATLREPDGPRGQYKHGFRSAATTAPPSGRIFTACSSR